MKTEKIFNAYNLSCLLTAIPRPSLESLLKAIRYAFLSLLHASSMVWQIRVLMVRWLDKINRTVEFLAGLMVA